MASRLTYFKLEVDVGDREAGELPEVNADILIPTKTGLKLVTQAVRAKGGRALWDLLLVIGSTPLLMSERTYERIRTLRLCPSIEWHPVQVTWRRSIYPYWVGETMTEHDIWDYEKSEYTLLYKDRPQGKTNVGLMGRAVMNPDLLPDLDLFRGRFNYWVGSEMLKNVWKAEGFNGMEFVELDVASES